MSEALFHETFGHAPDASLFTPGRVNLIGEHVDYNRGWVLPTALRLGVRLSASPRTDGRVRIVSGGFDGVAERTLDDPAQDHWSDYIVGALALAAREGFGPNGADVAVTTDLPVGAGLSSSAAVSVGTLDIALSLSGADRNRTGIATLARRVENDFIGVPCGIMDQMAVAVSKPGQALSLDTLSLDYGVIDLPNTHHMAVIHSGVHRQLNEGRYAERKAECDAVKQAAGREDICRISDAELETLRPLPDPLFPRARHCVTEHRRTVAAGEALKIRDMARFGQLMNDSHASLRDDFEVTVPAVDALVADAQSFGATGARMTGGGFGGCIVACVEADKLDAWRERLLAAHPDAFWVC